MEELTDCPGCNYARPILLELPCCSKQYCKQCLEHKTHCPSCSKTFNIMNCYPCQPLQRLVSEVLVDCKYCKYKTTEFLLRQHEQSCKYSSILNNELVEALMDPESTPKAVQIQRKRNIYSSFMMYSNVRHILDCLENSKPLDTTPLSVDVGEDGFYTHIILDSDTLPGLAVKYGVTTVEIKDVNRLYSDQIHERTALKIPRKNPPVFSEAEAAGLEQLLILRLVNRFRRRTSIKFNEEALYYLERSNMDADKAFELWKEDNDWEKTAPPFISCMPVSAYEELDLFATHKRSCCSLMVF